MTGGMVTLMSLYNTALHTWFNFTLFDWLSGMLLRWPIAFVTSLTIGDARGREGLRAGGQTSLKKGGFSIFPPFRAL